MLFRSALVAALRSRSDAKDFRLRHQATGASVALNITGVNTTACKVTFLLAAAIAAPGSDTYILTTGDLRNSASPFTTITGTGVGAASLAVTAATAALRTRPRHVAFAFSHLFPRCSLPRCARHTRHAMK